MRLIKKNGEILQEFVNLANRFGVVITTKTPPQEVNKYLQDSWWQTNVECDYQTVGNSPTYNYLNPLKEGPFCVSEMTQGIPPVLKKEYAGVVFLGATKPAIDRRLSWLVSQVSTEWGHDYHFGNKFYLLGGERKLNRKIEEPEVLLTPVLPVKKRWLNMLIPQFDEQLGTMTITLPTTEAEMMDFVFNSSQLPTDWKSELISARKQLKNPANPQDGLRDPNTEDTVKEWLYPTRSDRFVPSPGHYLILSGQPWCEYQKLVVERTCDNFYKNEVIPEGFTFDVCGPKAPPELALAKFLRALAKQFYEEALLFKKS